jgi:hypothetical protein
MVGTSVHLEVVDVGLFSKKPQQPVIDLREQPAKAAPFLFGYPTRCPSCGERGYLDHIDPFKNKQYEHCPSCSTKWELLEDEIHALNV